MSTKLIRLGAVLMLGIFMVVVPVMANQGAHHGELAGKFFHKAHFFYMNQEALGLSEEQAEAIKTLKMSVKKELIRKGAEIDLLKVDIKSLLWSPKIDTKAINELIDVKYELKKEQAKFLVAKIAEIKAILTDEQMAEAKAIWLKRSA